jgi:Cys-tRNA(Pro)/Cys-tRNA(Cys) deacylase
MASCRLTADELSAEKAAELLGLPNAMVYKTLLARGQDSLLFEVCLPAGTEIDLKALAKNLGQRSVSLVPQKELFPLTGYYRGGCSPLGGRHRFPVYIHEEVILLEKVAINAGAIGVMIFLSPEELIRVTQATLINIAKPKTKVS